MNSALIAIVTLLLAACSQGSGGVKEAKGDTPVKYVICGLGESDCFIAARFKDLASCEAHKVWSGMLCDSRSTVGEMHCREDSGPSVGVAYCTL